MPERIRVLSADFGYLLKARNIVVVTESGESLAVLPVLSMVAGDSGHGDAGNEGRNSLDDVKDSPANDAHLFPSIKLREERLRRIEPAGVLYEVPHSGKHNMTDIAASFAESFDVGDELVGECGNGF
jgi:hypothetical protein